MHPHTARPTPGRAWPCQVQHLWPLAAETLGRHAPAHGSAPSRQVVVLARCSTSGRRLQGHWVYTHPHTARPPPGRAWARPRQALLWPRCPGAWWLTRLLRGRPARACCRCRTSATRWAWALGGVGVRVRVRVRGRVRVRVRVRVSVRASVRVRVTANPFR